MNTSDLRRVHVLLAGPFKQWPNANKIELALKAAGARVSRTLSGATDVVFYGNDYDGSAEGRFSLVSAEIDWGVPCLYEEEIADLLAKLEAGAPYSIPIRDRTKGMP